MPEPEREREEVRYCFPFLFSGAAGLGKNTQRVPLAGLCFLSSLIELFLAGGWATLGNAEEASVPASPGHTAPSTGTNLTPWTREAPARPPLGSAVTEKHRLPGFSLPAPPLSLDWNYPGDSLCAKSC